MVIQTRKIGLLCVIRNVWHKQVSVGGFFLLLVMKLLIKMNWLASKSFDVSFFFGKLIIKIFRIMRIRMMKFWRFFKFENSRSLN